MAIRPIQKKQKIRRFLTFDLEWSKGPEVFSPSYHRTVSRPELRMVGVFDGFDYRYYLTIRDFLNNELTRENAGRWFYAHAGGLADMTFVLEYLANVEGYQVEASFSGSSAIIVHVSKGKHKWTFVDSLWLIRAPLRKIGELLGFEKGDVSSFDNATLEELIPYNERDCVLLWRAVSEFETRLLNLGGQLQMTQASCAMWLFRRQFLKGEIRTNESVNEKAREGYFASRVEPFKRTIKDGFYYDINSSFPHAMTFPVPGNLIRTGRKIPATWREDQDIFLAKVVVKVGDSEYFPAAPKRYKGSVFFPTGVWEGWYTNLDLQLLEETGGSIVSVSEVLWFEARDDLAGYAETLYELRRKSTNDVDRMVYKLLLNSLYGKFAERSEKSSLVLHPTSPEQIGFESWPRPWEMFEEGSPAEPLFPDAYIVTREADVPHCHVPISVHITSRARAALYRYMRSSEDFYYCDTDGFCTTKPDIPVSDQLGGLKMELEVKEGMFLRPKVYRIDDRVKAKGFTLRPERTEITPSGKRLEQLPEAEQKEYNRIRSIERWTEIMNGHDIEMRRFGRIKETFQRATSHGPELTYPTERTIKKGLRNVTRPKREWLENGDSRPWTVAELEG